MNRTASTFSVCLLMGKCFFLTWLVTNQVGLGDEPARQVPSVEKGSNEVKIPPPPDPKKVAKVIREARKALAAPRDGDEEAWGVSVLFGDSRVLGPFDPPERIKKQLLERRLRYHSWQARYAALFNFSCVLRTIHKPSL